jgi:hypothetical protein
MPCVGSDGAVLFEDRENRPIDADKRLAARAGKYPRHGRRRPAVHDCVPGMALISEVQVLYGPIGRNR